MAERAEESNRAAQLLRSQNDADYIAHAGSKDYRRSHHKWSALEYNRISNYFGKKKMDHKEDKDNHQRERVVSKQSFSFVINLLIPSRKKRVGSGRHERKIPKSQMTDIMTQTADMGVKTGISETTGESEITGKHTGSL